MRVLNVINTIDPATGGPVEWIRQFGTTAVAMGHQIEVVTMDHPDRVWADPFPLPTHHVGGTKGALYSKRLVPWLKKNARSYDCVIAHGLWRYSSVGTWRALRNIDIPYFLYTHGMLDPWFAKHYPIKHLLKSLYWPWTEYPTFRDACGVIFTCEQERHKASRAFSPYKCNEIVATLGITMPEGDVEQQRAAFYTQFPHTRDKELLLFLGRIHPKKGCDILIEAFARICSQQPNLNLIMAGPDHTDWINQLRVKAKGYGIADRITWTGMLSGDLKWGAIHCASAFILPSHQENFGIAVVEALACGVPVLISDKVDIWKEIQTGDAALVMQDNIESATETLFQWIHLSPDQKSNMSRKARQCYLDLFEITNATKGLFNLLESEISGRSR